ncbi:MAG: tetratricopeptide repeat protein [Acidobacteriota bacterium]
MRSCSAILLVLLIGLLLACESPPEHLLMMARQHWDQREYHRAIVCYEEFLQRQPQDSLSLQARSELASTYYLNLHDYTRAEHHYRLLLTEAGDQQTYLELTLTARRRLAETAVKNGQLAEAIAEYEQLILRVPATEARELRLQVANLYYDRNDLDQAELEYLKVVEDIPYDTFSEEAYLRIASIRHRLRRQYHSAIPIYEIIRNHTQQRAIVRAAYYGLAECYAADAEYKTAIQALKQLQNILDEQEIQQVRRQIKEYKQREKRLQRLPRVDWSNPRG